jgi:anthranilate phosphoribosyltransferase
VVVNSGAALWVAGKAGSIREGMTLAETSLDSGAAGAKLEALIRMTRQAGIPS